MRKFLGTPEEREAWLAMPEWDEAEAATNAKIAAALERYFLLIAEPPTKSVH
jgi:hypothetical protein